MVLPVESCFRIALRGGCAGHKRDLFQQLPRGVANFNWICICQDGTACVRYLQAELQVVCTKASGHRAARDLAPLHARCVARVFQIVVAKISGRGQNHVRIALRSCTSAEHLNTERAAYQGSSKSKMIGKSGQTLRGAKAGRYGLRREKRQVGEIGMLLGYLAGRRQKVRG